MTLAVLDELKAIGVEVVAVGDDLVIWPASKVPPELKERLRAAKPEILAVLAPPIPAQPVEPAQCAHCQGKGDCSCGACNLRRTDKAVPCSMCRRQERQVWLAATRPRECWFCEERRLHGAGGLCSNCEAKPVGVQ